MFGPDWLVAPVTVYNATVRDLQVGMAFPRMHQQMVHDGFAARNESDIIMLSRSAWAGEFLYRLRVNALTLATHARRFSALCERGVEWRRHIIIRTVGDSSESSTECRHEWHILVDY